MSELSVDPAFEDLYVRERSAVFATVFLLCRDRQAAEDATQEAFARALERWARLRGQPWAAGWVARTAMNEARRSMRRRTGWRGEREREATGPAGSAESLDLWDAVRRLPARQREAIVLRYRLDLDVAAIARILGCREGTVRTHLARARETLRGHLGGEERGYRRTDPVEA